MCPGEGHGAPPLFVHLSVCGRPLQLQGSFSVRGLMVCVPYIWCAGEGATGYWVLNIPPPGGGLIGYWVSNVPPLLGGYWVLNVPWACEQIGGQRCRAQGVGTKKSG